MSRTARRVRWSLALVGILAVVVVAWTGYQAVQASKAFAEIDADLTALRAELADGNTIAAAKTVTRMQGHADAAVASTRGPGWWLTLKIPGVNQNVEAIRTVAEAAQRLSYDALPKLVDVAGTLTPDAVRPEGGRVPIGRIAEVAPEVVAADESVQAQNARLQSLRTDQLAPVIGDAVRKVQDRLGEAASVTSAASKAVQLVPTMLGAEGERRYLLLFQNNAELRSLGGIGGSFAILTAKDGRVHLDQHADAGTIGHFDQPVLPLTAEEEALFGAGLGTYPQNITQTPDFARAAELLAEMWARTEHQKIDGVIATDPVALAEVLGGTGPISVPGGVRIDASNAVSVLLNRVYLDISNPADQNAFFDEVAGRVFSALSSGQGNPRKVMEGIARAASEGRLLVWSRHRPEQSVLASSRMGGRIDRWVDKKRPAVGVFMNESTSSKLDYYLDYRTSLDSVSCQSGRQQLTATLTVRSLVPDDVSRFPAYLVGRGSPLAAPGHMLLTVYVTSPLGGQVESGQVGRQELPMSVGDLDGHRVGAFTVPLAPGQTRTLTISLSSANGQSGDPVLVSTPGARGSGQGTVGVSACSVGRGR